MKPQNGVSEYGPGLELWNSLIQEYSSVTNNKFFLPDRIMQERKQEIHKQHLYSIIGRGILEMEQKEIEKQRGDNAQSTHISTHISTQYITDLDEPSCNELFEIDADASKSSPVDDQDDAQYDSKNSIENEPAEEKSSESNENENEQKEEKAAKDTTEDGITGKDCMRAGFAGRLTSDLINLAEDKTGIRSKMKNQNIVVTTVYAVGRNYVAQKVGTEIAKQAENVSLGIVDQLFDSVGSIGGETVARIGGIALYEVGKLILVKGYQKLFEKNADPDPVNINPAPDAPAAGPAPDRWYVAEICVICQGTQLRIDDNPNAVGFTPCHHVCLCTQCYERYQDRIVAGVPCYMCRAPIEQVSRF